MSTNPTNTKTNTKTKRKRNNNNNNNNNLRYFVYKNNNNNSCISNLSNINGDFYRNEIIKLRIDSILSLSIENKQEILHFIKTNTLFSKKINENNIFKEENKIQILANIIMEGLPSIQLKVSEASNIKICKGVDILREKIVNYLLETETNWNQKK